MAGIMNKGQMTMGRRAAVGVCDLLFSQIVLSRCQN